jgi:hypothetical protein
MTESIEAKQANKTPSAGVLAVDLVKALAWPIFAICVVVAFYAPLRRVVDLLPEMLGRADSISIAGVDLHMSGRIGNRVTVEVRKVLDELQPADIRKILETADNGSIWWDVVSRDEQTAWRRLAFLGLFREKTDKEVKDYNKRNGEKSTFGLETTELFSKTRDFLIDVTSTLIAEAKSPDRKSQDKTESKDNKTNETKKSK